MAITLQCPHCQTRLTLKDEFAGRRGKCPKCQGQIQVPAAGEAAPAPPTDAATIRATCDACGKTIKAPAALAGKRVKCPGCGGAVNVPGGAPPAPAPDLPPLSSAPQDAWFDQAMGESAKATLPVQPAYVLPAVNPYVAPASTPAPTKRKRSWASGDEDLNTLDWILVIFCGTIACILGIIWAIQGKPKGSKMIVASIIASILWGIVRVALRAALQ